MKEEMRGKEGRKKKKEGNKMKREEKGKRNIRLIIDVSVS